MYSVSPALYREVVSRLADAIDAKNYFSGSLAFPFAAWECRLTASVIVYRECIRRPDGDQERISDLVPVWWEFHTVSDEGEVLNDFAFSELRRYL
ncbi:hypothetical protein [Alistipes sp.]|uniref:hypothetical protein n=1 Tax=Alistipes sp. TaxID=1872444 RepID=UPI003AF0FDC1